MVEHFDDARHKAYMEGLNEKPAKPARFFNGNTRKFFGNAYGRHEAADGFRAKIGAGFKTITELPKLGVQKFGDALSGTAGLATDTVGGVAKWTAKTKLFRWGGAAALAGGVIVGVNALANAGKKKVSADDVAPNDTIAMANFDPSALPGAPVPTLMGEPLVTNGPHAQALGKAGQQPGFQLPAAPAGFEDVTVQR